jgi:hypothetical protein
MVDPSSAIINEANGTYLGVFWGISVSALSGGASSDDLMEGRKGFRGGVTEIAPVYL